jgi:hypothetical protein
MGGQNYCPLTLRAGTIAQSDNEGVVDSTVQDGGNFVKNREIDFHVLFRSSV